MHKSGISSLLFMFVFGILMFMVFHADRHFSDSLTDRRLHLERSLREASMPREQASILADAISKVGEDTHDNLKTAFPMMAALLSMAVAGIYDLHRRLKKLESRAQLATRDPQTQVG